MGVQPAGAHAHDQGIASLGGKTPQVEIPDRKIALISRMGWSPGCIRLPPASHPSEPCRNFPDCRPHPATYLLWISAVSGPGPANPLETRWIGLSQRGDGIHGTNNQSSVGKAVSNRCNRMRKADLDALFQTVPIGDTVVFIQTVPRDLARIFHPAPVAARAAAGGGE